MKLTDIIDNANIKEEFLWIVDDRSDETDMPCRFVKELNRQCDKVGWCSMKQFTDKDIFAIFEKAKRENVRIRGYYDLIPADNYVTDWYILKGKLVDNESRADSFNINGKIWTMETISSYKMLPWNKVIVSTPFSMLQESIVNQLEASGFTGAEYMWVCDRGKYKGKQYFHLIPQNSVPWYYSAVDFYDAKEEKPELGKYISAFGKNAECIWNNCIEVRMTFPKIVNRNIMPDVDIAALYSASSDIESIAVRKAVRDCLIENNILSYNDFEPMITLDTEEEISIDGYRKIELDVFHFPEKIKKHYDSLYQTYKNKVHPVYHVTEKKSLTVLRKIKSMCPENFARPLSAKKVLELPDQRLAPYYRISNGGILSAEYRYFSLNEMIEKVTSNYEKGMDIFAETDKYVIFGECADGDQLVLLQNGRVIRYQPENPDCDEQWENLPEFFYESLQ